MYTSANLGLTIWDQALDDFNHAQLLGNWLALDQHDHTSGRGVQIPTAGIHDAAVTATKLAPGAVGNPALQALSVATANLQDQSVTTPKIAPGAITGTLIPDGSITITKLDPTILPLGFTALWWAPPGSGATPGGVWEAMDGRAWSSITNAWGLTSGNIPDTRGLFVKGASMTGLSPWPAIAATGGSPYLSLAHTHSVLGHSHGLSVHSHGLSADGSHAHAFGGGFTIWTRPNAFNEGVTLYDWNGNQRQNVFQSLYLRSYNANGTSDLIATMDQQGLHNHGGATQLGGAGSTASATSSTDERLSGLTTLDPPWVGLVYIMRVR